MDSQALARAVIDLAYQQSEETQAQIAQRCGCSTRTVGRWLRDYRHYRQSVFKKVQRLGRHCGRRRDAPRWCQGVIIFPADKLRLTYDECAQIVALYRRFGRELGLGADAGKAYGGIGEHLEALLEQAPTNLPQSPLPPAELACSKHIRRLLRRSPAGWGIKRKVWTVAVLHEQLRREQLLPNSDYAVDTLRKKMRQEWGIDIRAANASHRQRQKRKRRSESTRTIELSELLMQ